MPEVRSSDGTRIGYDSTGNGQAMILVDGSLASRTLLPSADGLESLLASSCTVYRYDRRGRGDSATGSAPVLSAEIDDLRALIYAAGGSAAVCGFSSGAVLALEAARAGLAISKVIVQEPPFVVTQERTPVPPDYPVRLQQLLDAGDRDGAVALHLTEAVGTPAEYINDMRRHPSWGQMTQAADSLPYDAAVMAATMSGDPSTLDRYAAVTTPTLVLYGSNTEQWIISAAHALTAVLPDARQQSLDGQDHMVTASAIAPALLQFLDN